MSKAITLPFWSSSDTKIPEQINSQLVGTFPALVRGEDGKETCAFFVRALSEEFHAMVSGAARCLVKPQFVKTPQGPIVVAYCMASGQSGTGSEPYISEISLFPRLTSMPGHRRIYESLLVRSDVYFVVCDENGDCLLNSNAQVLDEWRRELAEKGKGFDEGKQVTDEKTAIMSLYWYQERYNPSSKIFEIRS